MRKTLQEAIKDGLSTYVDTFVRVAPFVSIYLAASSHPPLTIRVDWTVVTLIAPVLIILVTQDWE